MPRSRALRTGLSTRLLAGATCVVTWGLAALPAAGQTSSTLFNFWRGRLGSAETRVVDGKFIKMTPLGSIAVTRLSDGQRLVISPDGTERYDFPNGRVLIKYPTGRQVQTEADGTRIVTEGGTKVIYFPDGREEHSLADGRFIVKIPTGAISRSELRPNGIRIWTYRAGHVVWFFPTGVRKTFYPDGTIVTGTWVTAAGSGGPTGPGGSVLAPSKPAGLTVGVNPGGGLRLDWQDHAWNEQNFVIQRVPAFPGGGSVDVGPNMIAWVDPSAPMMAEYRVASANAAGVSSFTPWTGLASEPGEFPRLIPGEGFTGPTEQPAAVGDPSMPGYDAKAIARWDVVPYQTFEGDFHIGVVAFHMNGIDRVSFSVEGGPWTDVEEMKLNPQTGVWEYTVTLRAGYFEDGAVEVRAIAWPEGAGEARVLGGEINQANLANGEHSMIVNANEGASFGPGVVYVSATRGDDSTGDGSFASPFATIWRAFQKFSGANVDGLDMLLEPGSYAYGSDTNTGRPVTATGWVTIRPAPSAPDGSVVFTSGGRYRVANIRLQDVTIDFSNGGAIGNYTVETLPSMMWLDNVSATGPGPGTGARLAPPANWLGLYFTDSEIGSFTDGTMHAQIVRGVHLSNLGQDAFTGSHLVLNSTVSGLASPAGSGYHADIYQFAVTPGNRRDNVIVYGVVASDVSAQGLFADDGGTVDNVAFVNVLIDTQTHKSQWKDVASNHILFWHTSLPNQPMAWRTGLHQNISIVGSVWKAIEGATTLLSGSGLDIRSNHFVTTPGVPVGTDTSVGDPAWNLAAPGVYVPAWNSLLRGRVADRLTPIDAHAERRTFPASDIGAVTFEYSGAN